jgi:cell division septal protein FtsQ
VIEESFAAEPVPKGRRDESPSEGKRRRPRIKLALFGIVALLILGSPFWAPLLLRRMDFFRVRRLEILGTHYIGTSDIVARASVDTTRSVWDPTGPIADRVRGHPGVEAVHVTRKLPGTVVIAITERQPVALVPSPQGFRAYDARGVALPIDLTRVAVDAPVVARRDTALFRLLGEMRGQLRGLYDRVSEIKRVGANELVFQLAELPVRAPAAVTLDDLNQIQSVEDDLRRRAARASELDLRYSGQIIARLP